MSDLNSVTVTGNIVRDAELKYTNTGVAVAKITLACNRRRKKGDQWVDEASFIDCTLWGKRAESMTQYLTKGSRVGVVGELRQNKWEQDGQPRSKIEININDIALLGGGRQGGQQSGTSAQAHDSFQDDIPF